MKKSKFNIIISWILLSISCFCLGITLSVLTVLPPFIIIFGLIYHTLTAYIATEILRK